MLHVGLTGGIGSGKSTAGRVFAALGIPVYDSDTRAKELMGNDPEVRYALIREFGDETYVNGCLDRKYLASKVFTDKEALSRLNGIVHPAVYADFKRWAESRVSSGVPYVVLEAAILFEAGFGPLVDYSVTISAPLEERIARTSERDNISPELVRERVANQMTDTEREKLADYVLSNGDGELMLPQILTLHEKLVKLNAERNG